MSAFTEIDPTRGYSEPDRLWSMTNLVEGTPKVLTPFCWTFWTRGTELGSRANYADLGVIPRSQVELPDDQNERIIGCFYGRQAINVDVCRQLFGVIPGVDAESFVRDMFGMDSSDRPPVKTKLDRAALIAVKVPWTVARQGRRQADLYRDVSAWWRRDVLRAAPAAEPLELMRAAGDWFIQGIREQTYARGALVGLVDQIRTIAKQVGRPDLALTVMSGLGGVAEAGVMDDLWLVSRNRLQIEEFLRRHGYHGSAEGNPVGHSWREHPEWVEALATQLRDRADHDRPLLRQERTQAESRMAAAELVARLSPLRRRKTRLLLKLAAALTRKVEVAKTCYVAAVDGARKAVRDLGAGFVELGVLDEVDDAFYFTYDELLGPLPADAREIVKRRRELREQYKRLDLPVSFQGMPVPLEIAVDGRVDEVSITGIGASPGTATGRARIILDPSDAHLDEGDVLVCHTTDPGWCGVFTLAEALIIDVGAVSSHGAIVARELGVPCVIGTGNGTKRIQEGDMVEVDGTNGTVTVVRRIAAKAAAQHDAPRDTRAGD